MKAQDRKIFLRNPYVPPDAKVVWLVIETYANADGTNAWPVVKTIMAGTGMGKKWVEAQLRFLKLHQFLVIGKRKHQKSGLWGNDYVLKVRGDLGPLREGRFRTHNQVPYTKSASLAVESEAILHVLPDPVKEDGETYG